MPAKMTWDTREIEARVEAAIKRSIVRGTEAVSTEVTRLILEGSKSGRVYRRRGVEHQASAPGEAPASDTGKLLGSIDTDYTFSGEVWSGRVNIGAEYAEGLELGTERVAPRPFARPALANKRDEIIQGVQEEVAAALK